MPSINQLFVLSLTAVVACTSVGCASSGGGAASSAGIAQSGSALKRDRNTIFSADMQDLAVSNLYEAVQRLHPEWLNARNAASVGRRTGLSNPQDDGIQVYFGTQRAGNTDLLKTMPISSATALHFYSASEAQARFGTGNLNGVIQIVTEK